MGAPYKRCPTKESVLQKRAYKTKEPTKERDREKMSYKTKREKKLGGAALQRTTPLYVNPSVLQRD